MIYVCEIEAIFVEAESLAEAAVKIDEILDEATYTVRKVRPATNGDTHESGRQMFLGQVPAEPK